MEKPIIFIAEFSHETNTFSGEPTHREHFQERREYFGKDMLTELEGTNTTIGGGIEVGNKEDVIILPSIAAAAMPSGRVTGEAYEFYTDQILSDIQEVADDIDGVFLSLHGAMVQEDGVDGEGMLIEAVRNVIGPDTPIVVTLDLHGNITETMIDAADALVAFESYPHTDMGATGQRAMELLLETISNDINPVMDIERPPVLPYGPMQNTRTGPMAKIMDKARALEKRDGVLKVNVFPGFHQADVPSMGFSIPVVVNTSKTHAQEVARELAEMVWNRRKEFITRFPSPDEAVGQAKELVDEGITEDGPVVLADLGDNPGGGGATDGTTILRELVNQKIKNSGFALIHDPKVVNQAIQNGVGKQIKVTLGGKKDSRHGEPIKNLELYIKSITDGQFRNTGPMGTGTRNDLNRAVRAQINGEDGIEVILANNRIQPLDAEIWRHLGIQPERLDIIVVKSTNHYRADYEPMASKIIPVDSPGLVAVNPERFDYKNIQRPKFPIDNMDNSAYPDWELNL